VSVWFQYSHILFIAKRFSFGAFRRFFGFLFFAFGDCFVLFFSKSSVFTKAWILFWVLFSS